MDINEHSGFVHRLAAFPLRRPVLSLLAGLVVFLGVGFGASRVQSNSDPRVWLDPDDQNLVELDAFEKRFGNDVSVVLVVHSPSGMFDADSAQLLQEVTDRMWKVSRVIRVSSLSNFSWVHANGEELVVEPLLEIDPQYPINLADRRKVALEHEQLPGYLVSPDGNTAIVYGWMAPVIGAKRNNAEVIDDVRKIIADFSDRGDHTFYITGGVAIEYTFETVSKEDFRRVLPIIFSATAFLLLLFFRRASGLVLPLTVTILAVVSTIAVAGWAGFAMNATTFVGPEILVAIAISNSIHILRAYFRALDHGVVRREAAAYSLRRTLQPTLFACATTGIGFLSFIFSPVAPIQNLGIMVAAGTLLVWLYLWLIMGALMVIVPIRSKAAKGAKPVTPEELDEPVPAARQWIRWVDSKKVPIVVAWSVLALAAVFGSVRNEVRYDIFKFFPKDAMINQAHDFMESNVGWAKTLEISVSSGENEGIKEPAFLAKVDQLESWIVGQDYVSRATSLVDILKQTNRALHRGQQSHFKIPETRRAVAEQFLLYSMNLPAGQHLNDRVSVSNDVLRMTVWWKLRDSKSTLAAVAAIEVKAEELGLDIRVTGRSLLLDQLSPYVVSTVSISISLALATVTVILILFFRSIRIGLLSLIPNLVPLALGGGLLYAVGKPIDITIVLVFSVALGLAVDDTVHFLAGYNRQRQLGYQTREALERVMTSVAPAMVITTAVVATTFGLLMLGDFVPVRNMGLLIASMLVVALAADFCLLPALVLLRKRAGDSKNEGNQTGEA